MRRKTFAARVWSRLVAFERGHGLLPRGARVLAAVSGGPDSVCLAHFLCAMRRRRGFEVALVYVDHGLRRASKSEGRFVERLGRTLGAQVFVVSADVAAAAKRRGGGTEDAARVARYEALARVAAEGRFDVVAAGHHMDDQAETVLLHLLRARRAAPLAAMAASRTLAPGVKLVRPLLSISRADVDAYLELHGLKSRLDRTNRSKRFLRNWVRAELLPSLELKQPRIREHLCALADDVRALTRSDVD